MYKKLNNECIQHIDSKAFINPETNREYLAWVALGNTAIMDLEDAKLDKFATIEQDRDNQCVTNVFALNHYWQADTNSRTLLSQVITLCSAGLPLPPVWRDVDNNNVTITSINDLLAIAGAIAQQIQTAYSTSWSRKAALIAATTLEEVGAI